MTALLIILALLFAWSMGAHYTGACMGVPHALGALTRWQALILMAPLAWLGAAIASHAVERTVAQSLTTARLAVAAEIVVVGLAFALTTLFTRLKFPTSTIQILVFCIVGVALGEGAGVRWTTIGLLAITWVSAPIAAFALGYVLTKALDRFPGIRERERSGGEEGRGPAGGITKTDALGIALAVVGAAASFVMGSNDVANATGSLVATRTFSPLDAGIIGGAGLAVGVLTWGRPLLERVAFDIVQLDRPMATAAQGVQGVVVITAVSFGYFTSMNQALVGAMTGAGLARGRETVRRPVLVGILGGWFIGPGSALAVAYGISRLAVALGGAGVLK